MSRRNDPDDATLFNGPSNERRLPIFCKSFRHSHRFGANQ